MKRLFAFSVMAQVASAMIPMAMRSFDSEVVDQTYMVAVKKDATTEVVDQVESFLAMDGTSEPQKYSFGKLTVFKVKLTDGELADVRSNTEMETHIDYIEQDTTVEGATVALSCPKTQDGEVDGLTWAMDVLSSPTVDDGLFEYDPTWGTGVDAYVLDSGVRCTHTHFEGRCHWGYNMVANTSWEDENGHGTHVAGTIASKTFGVAKSANIIAVKVLGADNRGRVSDIIAGLQWIETEVKRTKRPSVINQSIGGGVSQSWDNVIEAVIESGIQIILSAGNNNMDACQRSPTRVGTAVRVGSFDKTLTRASTSNFGSCVDIWGPGEMITSLSNSDDISFTWKSGTSMAAPHVAGLLVAYLTHRPTTTPAELKQWVVDTALADRLTDIQQEGSPNAMIHLSCHRGATPVPTPAPPTPVPGPTHVPAPTPEPAEPTIAPTPTPKGSEENCYRDYEYFKDQTGNVAHPGRGTYKSGENSCFFILCSGDITIQFNKLDTETDADYVRLYTSDINNEDDVTLLHEFSGSTLPTVTPFKGNALIRFTSDKENEFTGFDLDYSCSAAPPSQENCDGKYDMDSDKLTGTVFYPLSDDLTYKNMENRCFIVRCPGTVTVTFDKFDLEDSKDYLRLYTSDRDDSSLTLREEFTGPAIPVVQNQVLGDLLIRFTSDEQNVADGFGLSWQCNLPTQVPTPDTDIPSLVPEYVDTPQPDQEVPKFCSDFIVRSDGNGIIDHATGNSYYGNYERKCWKIECDGTLTLTWTQFSTEWMFDFVYLYLQQASGDYKYQGRRSGHFLPPNGEYGSNALIRFQSDAFFVDYGFKVEYSCAPAAPPTPVPVPPQPSFCGEYSVQQGDSGVIDHPEGINNYEPNESNCWVIVCDGAVTLQWVGVATEQGYDFVYIYSLLSDGSLWEVTKYSGSGVPFPSTHTGNMIIHFKSDALIESYGFKLSWTCSSQ